MRRLTAIPVAAAAVALLGTVLAPPASAGPDATARAVAKGLVTPLSLAVTPNDTMYVSQNFAGILTKKRPGHAPKVVFAAEKRGTEVGAVSFRDGEVTFATTWRTEGKVWRLGKKGNARLLGNVGRFEENQNPDGEVVYGLRDVDDACLAEWPEDFGPSRYEGIIETHPYATEMTGDTTYVADAAGNSVLGISGGKVSLVSVLPAIPVEIPAVPGIPECAVGHDFWFEAVPTDVEMGRDGMLYVTSLPGGPEDGSLGAQGSVFRVDPETGESEKVVGGLMSPTGVDVARNGDLYVGQLFGGSIVRVAAGSSEPEPYKSVPLPADIEWRAGRVFATTNVLAEGPMGKVQSWAD